LQYIQTLKDYLKNTFPEQTRTKTWSEFLGVNESTLQSTSKPAEGWLQLWSSKAREKLSSLKTEPNKLLPQRILPYTPKTKAVDYLKALGVNTETLQVEDSISIYLLNKRKWESVN